MLNLFESFHFALELTVLLLMVEAARCLAYSMPKSRDGLRSLVCLNA